MNKVLNQWYDRLPDNDHKTCLLFLSIFPRDYPIKRKSIIRRWVAEGLAWGEAMLSAEQVASNRFDELIDRSIIKPVKIGNNSKVKRCRVPTVMLEFIVHKSVSNDMATIFHDDQPLHRKKVYRPVRRLSIHSCTPDTGRVAAEIGLKLNRARSLTICNCYHRPFDFHTCRLLRVLDLEGCGWVSNNILRDICRSMVLLKYLSLRNTEVGKIPNAIGNLHDLETLDIRETQVTLLPVEVLMLPRLAHLFGQFELPQQLKNKKKIRSMQRFFSEQSRLQTLSGLVMVGNNGFGSFEPIVLHLRLLRILKIWCKYGSSKDSVSLLVSSFPQRFMVNNALESLSIDFGGSNMGDYFADYFNNTQSSDPCMLRSIKLRGKLRDKLPDFITSAANNLSELQLSSTGLPLEELSSLQSLRWLLLSEAG